MTLTFAGLFADVIGATLLVAGLLYRDLAIIRQANPPARAETWTQRIIFAGASWIGSTKALATFDATGEELEQASWGWLLLVLGFILQACGIWFAR